MLGEGKQIILANWPIYKRIICTYNNNIPVNIPSHSYVLLDRNISCNCDIEAESNFLLESLAACDEHEKPDLEMYFMVNLAFMDYLVQLNVTLNTPINRNWMSVKQFIPISLNSFQINPKLMHAPIMLKDFMEQYWENRMTIARQENPKSRFWKFINSFLSWHADIHSSNSDCKLSPCNNLRSCKSIKIKGIIYHHGFAKN